MRPFRSPLCLAFALALMIGAAAPTPAAADNYTTQQVAYKLDAAPSSTAGCIASGGIAGVAVNVCSGNVLVPSGSAKGLWQVKSGAWAALSTDGQPTKYVSVLFGTQNGPWCLPQSGSAYGQGWGCD